jgi:hypothetical protein
MCLKKRQQSSMLDAFIEAANRREQAYPLYTRPEE